MKNLFKPLLICLPFISTLASSALAQDAEAAICGAWDGPLMRGGRMLCTQPPARPCSKPAFRAGAMICLDRIEAPAQNPAPVSRSSSKAKDQWAREAERAAKRHGIPVTLFAALVHQESRWNVSALSPKGAIGLAQLMPPTAKALGVDPHDPIQNLDGGARYLKAMFLKFGDWDLALAAYNAGPAAVEKYAGIPPYSETTHYVATVLESAGFPGPGL